MQCVIIGVWLSLKKSIADLVLTKMSKFVIAVFFRFPLNFGPKSYGKLLWQKEDEEEKKPPRKFACQTFNEGNRSKWSNASSMLHFEHAITDDFS